MSGVSTGAELIAAERQRQVDVEGWTAIHDDDHDMGELAIAAACYALDDSSEWPWDPDDWRPTDDPIRQLVKAGALIAAEIDRLRRRGGNA